jgi:predicted GNAT superfamily acetyltransferase
VLAVADEPIAISTEMEEAVLAPNNAHAVELSWLEREQLRVLLQQSF